MKHIINIYLLLDHEKLDLIDHLLTPKFSASSQTSFHCLLLILEAVQGNGRVSRCTQEDNITHQIKTRRVFFLVIRKYIHTKLS